MIQRVFDYAEVPCRCVLKIPDSEPVLANVEKISKAKVILASSITLTNQQQIELQLQLLNGPTLDLQATVIDSGQHGLFLRWEHAHPEGAARLQSLLVQYAGRSQPTQQAAPAAAGDVGSAILSRARTVRSAELAAQHSTVRVLNMGTIAELIQQAVNEALKRTERSWNEAERRNLLEEATESFNERFKALEAEKAGLEDRTRSLAGQLKRAQKFLDEEREKVLHPDQFTVSEAGIAELECRMGRILDRAVQKGGLSGALEAEMREMVARLLDDERAKITEKAQQAQNDAIRILESKIERLAGALDETQKGRELAERRAHALEMAGGGSVNNIMLPGLSDEDPDRTKKLELLKEIVEMNRAVRNHMISREDKPTEDTRVKQIAVPEVEPPPLERVRGP
ncbi:MAG: hypothetical protein V3T77_08600 [Planctomycetota bacterium]